MGPVQDFYSDNTELSIVLVSVIGTFLCMKLLPGVWSALVSGALRVGGTLNTTVARWSFERQYLTWVVLEQRPMSLSGAIGSGPKPLLEDVFVPIGVRDTDAPEETVEPTAPTRRPGLAERMRLTPLYFLLVASRVARSVNMAVRGGTRVSAIEYPFPGRRTKRPRLRYFLDRTRGLWLPGGLVAALAAVAGGVAMLYWLVWRVGGWLHLLAVAVAVAVLLPYLLRRTYRGERDPAAGVRERAVWRLLLSAHQRVALLGEPGAGKTSLLQYIAITLAGERAGERRLRRAGIVKKRLGDIRWMLPIHIPLRTVRFDGDKGSALLSAFLRTLPTDIQGAFRPEWLERHLGKGDCVLLLDGVDEVSTDEQLGRLRSELRGMVARYPKARMIITSRHAGWRGGPGIPLRQLRVEELTPPQRDRFVHAWFDVAEREGRTDTGRGASESERRFGVRRAREKAERLLAAFEEVPAIGELARNPLLLSLMCYVHYHKQLPRERASLYSDCSEFLLGKWDEEKGAQIGDTRLTLLQKELIMQDLAFAAQSRGIGNGREFSKPECVGIVASRLHQYRLDDLEPGWLFDKLVERSGIVVTVEAYADAYMFAHLTFQEYYSAKHVLQRGVQGLQEVLDSFEAEIDGRWREPLLLYSSLVPDSTELLRRLPSRTDLFGRRVGLAVQLVEYATSVEDRSTEETAIEDAYRAMGLNTDAGSVSRTEKRLLCRFVRTDQFAVAVATRHLRGLAAPAREQTILECLQDTDHQQEARWLMDAMLGLEDPPRSRPVALALLDLMQGGADIDRPARLLMEFAPADVDMFRLLSVLEGTRQGGQEHSLRTLYYTSDGPDQLVPAGGELGPTVYLRRVYYLSERHGPGLGELLDMDEYDPGYALGHQDPVTGLILRLFPEEREVATRLHAMYVGFAPHLPQTYWPVIRSLPPDDLAAAVDRLLQMAREGGEREQEFALSGLAQAWSRCRPGPGAQVLLDCRLSSPFFSVRLAAFRAAQAADTAHHQHLRELIVRAVSWRSSSAVLAALRAFVLGRGFLGQERFELARLVSQLPEVDPSGESAPIVMELLKSFPDMDHVDYESFELGRAACLCLLKWDSDVSAQDSGLVLRWVVSEPWYLAIRTGPHFRASHGDAITEKLLESSQGSWAFPAIIALHPDGLSPERVDAAAAGSVDSSWDEALVLVYPQLLTPPVAESADV